MNGGVIGKTCKGRGVYTVGDHLLNIGRSRIPERAILFDGTDDYASLGCQTLGATLATGSVEFWIKTTSTAQKMVFGTGNDGYAMSLFVQINSDKLGNSTSGYLRFFLRDNSNVNMSFGTTASCSFNDGLWHHVCWTFIAGSTRTAICYLDGVSIATGKSETGSAITNFGNFQYPLILGANNGRGTIGDFFPGYLDEFRLWTDVRTQAEVREYMKKRVVGTEAGLYGAWHLDDGGGTAIADAVGSNNGTLSGGTWVDPTDIAWWDEAV